MIRKVFQTNFGTSQERARLLEHLEHAWLRGHDCVVAWVLSPPVPLQKLKLIITTPVLKTDTEVRKKARMKRATKNPPKRVWIFLPVGII